MTQVQLQPDNTTLEAASVSDRGLSDKRPVNEDSCLCDSERRLFIVADGVGGAQAGEVASQTAVELLSEAFRFHPDGNEDYEDLMELAIQRANASIYQMSREHPQFSTMATTVVALHLNGLQATIGHVGDSRLYRLAPDGRLYRETHDHSIVEEEVRAGRMTPEQAANHPSRNVISRALGAEATVEVDMRTITFDAGTAFLLCSDGITRHISDTEICELLNAPGRLEEVCAEMKRICYERGAEDNLTAVIVRAGATRAAVEDDEQTHASARPAPDFEIPNYQPQPAAAPPPLAPAALVEPPAPVTAAIPVKDERGGGLKKFFLFLLFLGSVAGAFYGGLVLRDKFIETTGLGLPGVRPPQPAASPSPTPSAAKEREQFMLERNAVDANPEAWLKKQDAAGVANPSASALYLRGRAYLVQGKSAAAIEEFDKALAAFLRAASAEDPMLKLEIKAARLRAQFDAKAESVPATDKVRQDLNNLLGLPATDQGTPSRQ
jgi:protein phosphatase